MDKVATIILNYNGKNFLERFLPGVVKNNDGFPVYVVDNHSTDQSVEFLKTHFPRDVKCIQLDDNFGFCGGYNRAAELIDAEYYVFLNSDIDVTPDWLSPMVRWMEEHKHIAACQPKLIDYTEKGFFEYAGAGGGFIDLLGYPFCRGRIFQTLEYDYGQYNDNIEVFWTSGACMLIRSEVFREMGGFDEDFFAHMEEVDLCWRIKKTGMAVAYFGGSTVYHVGGGTLHQSNPFKTYLNFRNSLITLLKNEPVSNLWWKFPARIILDQIAAFKFLIADSYKDALVVLKADFHVLSKIIYYRRKGNDGEQRRWNSAGMYGKSIVFSYYILRRRYFFKLRSIVPNHVIPSP